MTKADLYACKSLLSSTHLAMTQYLAKNGKPQETIPDLGKLTEYLEDCERHYESKS
jgi:hypothetical protein